jgi:hypothetical protein
MHGALTPVPLMSSWFGASSYTGTTTSSVFELEEDARKS